MAKLETKKRKRRVLNQPSDKPWVGKNRTSKAQESPNRAIYPKKRGKTLIGNS